MSYRSRCPSYPIKTKEKVEQGKGTANHLMSLGYLFFTRIEAQQRNEIRSGLLTATAQHVRRNRLQHEAEEDIGDTEWVERVERLERMDIGDVLRFGQSPIPVPYQNPFNGFERFPSNYPQIPKKLDHSQLYNDERRAAPQPNRLSVIQSTVILSDERVVENIMRGESSADFATPSHRAGNNM